MIKPKDLTIIQLAALGAYDVSCNHLTCGDCPLEKVAEGDSDYDCESYAINNPHEVLRIFGVNPDIIADASGTATITAKEPPKNTTQADVTEQPQAKKQTPFICDIKDTADALRQCERWEKDACYERGIAKGLYAALAMICRQPAGEG